MALELYQAIVRSDQPQCLRDAFCKVSQPLLPCAGEGAHGEVQVDVTRKAGAELSTGDCPTDPNQCKF